MTTTDTPHVVIIGGGISGLSAAWYTQQRAQKAGLPLRCTVLEGSNRWGGKIDTERVNGFGGPPFIVEGGPDSFITQKPWALQLARELGMEERLLGTNDDMRKTFVVHRGKPVPLPDGVLLIVPTKFMPFALSSLISPLGKLRMGLDLFIPAKRDGKDETLANFVRRRLGSEALDKIAEPLMSGIYNAEADRQSLLATFPRFRKIEEEHGSLIKGMLASKRRPRPQSPNGSKAPALFTTFKGGTDELVTELVNQLTGDLRLNTQLERLTPRDDSRYTLSLSDGTALVADTVVLAIPAYHAADLVCELAPDAAEHLDAIRYVSTGTISFAFRKSDLKDILPGFGLVVPNSEKRPINAITINSTKFNHRAPEGHLLLRAFFGGSRSPESMALDDDTLVNTVRKELRELMGIEAEPLFHRVYRWHNANPQYDVGHMERVDAIEAALPQGVIVTGSPYRGVGMPDCVHMSQQTADRVVERLQAHVSSLAKQEQPGI